MFSGQSVAAGGSLDTASRYNTHKIANMRGRDAVHGPISRLHEQFDACINDASCQIRPQLFSGEFASSQTLGLVLQALKYRIAHDRRERRGQGVLERFYNLWRAFN